VTSDAALEREALRIYRRYQKEVVEALGLCPWAERAEREGHVRPRVVLDPAADVAHALGVVKELSDDESVEVGLMIYPRVRMGRLEWERFVRHVRDADAAARRGAQIAMAMAAFHPDAPADLTDAARLVPFTRRSPDPTIQLVRKSVLDRVRHADHSGTGFVDPSMLAPEALAAAARPPLHEMVHEANLATIRELGVERLERIFAAIREDRDRAYAAC
jgi:hypothetical protein